MLGDRRIDLVFVLERDLIGVEIKSGADTLARLAGQMKEYRRYLPELWVAAALKWKDLVDSQTPLPTPWARRSIPLRAQCGLPPPGCPFSSP